MSQQSLTKFVTGSLPLHCSNRWLCICVPCLVVLTKYCHSLLTHINAVFHVLPNINRATLLYEDRFEIRTLLKDIFINLLKRVGQHDFFNTTVTKAFFADVLHAIRDFNALEVIAKTERLFLDPLQC